MAKFQHLPSVILLLGLSQLTTLALGQTPNQYGMEQNALDGAYVPENWLKQYIPWPHVREADVMYKRRIWQEIDLRQKFNYHLYFPVTEIANRRNLYQVIRRWTTGPDAKLTAYSIGELGNNDSFLSQYVMSPSEVEARLSRTKKVAEYNEAGTEITGYKDITTPIESSEITRYRIKEDWIWDRQRSERYVRIIAIAPMIEVQDDEGNIEGYEPLFWLNYRECRNIFCMEEAYNIFNDAQRRTFDDIFEKRYFNSYIVKEDNAFDRQISSYARGIDALAESERIQEILFNMEHDIWHY